MFALPSEIEALRDAALDFSRRSLQPGARDSEASGRWPDAFLKVLDEFSLRRLDADAGWLAKSVLLEALATGDAGGLPAADQPGISAGAVIACPDGEDVAKACLAGEASCVLACESTRVEWAPGWPPLRWAFAISGDELSLFAIDVIEDAKALAFGASGGISARFGDRLGSWNVRGLDVRGRARLWTASVALGVAQDAFDATIAYTSERIVFGKPVAHHQGNAFELAAAATNMHGARLAVRDAARRFDNGDAHAAYWATQAWLQTMEAAQQTADLGVQLLGGHGFLMDHMAEKRFREIGMLRLLVGGREGAERDVASLDVPDPIFS